MEEFSGVASLKGRNIIMVALSGVMAEFTEEPTSTIRSMASESSNGQTAENTSDNGKMVSNKV